MGQGQQQQQAEQRSTFERHAQSIVQGLILVGVVWVASSVSSLREDVAVLKEKVSGVDGLRVAVDALDDQVDEHDTDLKTLDQRVRRLEGERLQ